jgi:hypothetical protein
VIGTVDRPRLLFSAVILLGHAATIYFLMMGIRAPRIVRDDEFSGLPIYVMSMTEPEREKPRKAEVADGLAAKKSPPPESTAITTPDPLQESSTTQAPVQETSNTDTTRPDWALEAQKSVRESGRSTHELKRFGSTPQDGPPSDDAPVSIFDGKSPRRAGYVESLGPGYERRWLSSRCYREFGAPPSLSGGTGFIGTPITCLIGSGPPNGHLFDHLKPKYLSEQE